MFVNDKRPRATNGSGELQGEADWELLTTVVERGATIGSGATILGGVRIGAEATVGAGAVVTKDVAAGAHRGRQPGAAARRLRGDSAPALEQVLVGHLADLTAPVRP